MLENKGMASAGVRRLASVDATKTPTHFLSTLRRLAPRALIDADITMQIIALLDKIFALDIARGNFNEDCEGLVTLFYLALLSRDEGIVSAAIRLNMEFVTRWFDEFMGHTLLELASVVPSEQKTPLFSCHILLLCHLDRSQKYEIGFIDDCLSWDSDSPAPSQWLQDTTCSPCYADLNRLLHKSLTYAKGEFSSPHTVSSLLHPVSDCNSYIFAMVDFLCACSLHHQGEFERSGELLHRLDMKNCSPELIGWSHWLLALNLCRLGRNHLAIRELQCALHSSATCAASMFNIASIYAEIEQLDSAVEIISLLVVEAERIRTESKCLQGVLIAYHNPMPNLKYRALYALGVTCIKNQKLSKACEAFAEIVCGKTHQVVAVSGRNFILEEDLLPNLPCIDYIRIIAAITLVLTNDNEGTVQMLQYVGIGDNFRVPQHVHLLISCVKYLLIAHSVKNSNHTMEAVNMCLRSQEFLNRMEIPDTENIEFWHRCVTALSASLYTLLSKLHGNLQHKNDERHYNCLAAPSVRAFEDDLKVVSINNVEASLQTLIDIILFYITKLLKDL